MILGASILQLPAIEEAKKMGLEVVAVDMNPEAVGFKVDGVEKEVISTIDIDKVVETAIKHKIDGVMTLASDMPMRTVAAVSQKLGIIGIDSDTAIRATNKAEMRKCLAQNKVPVPMFFKVSNEEEYFKVVSAFKKPFIVKPADNSGSRGIFLVKNQKDTKNVRDAYKYSKNYSRNGDIVVEEYMSGKEVSVETLSINGITHVIQITDKITTGAPYFVEMGHTQPTSFDEIMVKRIKKIAVDAVNAIGIKDGPAHTEIMVTENGPKIVELGARLGGDCITSHLVPLSTGVNMVRCCINIALGEEADISPKFQKGSAIRYFPQQEGIIVKINGEKEALSVSGIKQISFTKGIGDTLSKIKNSGERLGFVIAQGEDKDSAVKSCEKAIEKINVELL